MCNWDYNANVSWIPKHWCICWKCVSSAGMRLREESVIYVLIRFTQPNINYFLLRYMYQCTPGLIVCHANVTLLENVSVRSGLVHVGSCWIARWGMCISLILSSLVLSPFEVVLDRCQFVLYHSGCLEWLLCSSGHPSFAIKNSSCPATIKPPSQISILAPQRPTSCSAAYGNCGFPLPALTLSSRLVTSQEITMF